MASLRDAWDILKRVAPPLAVAESAYSGVQGLRRNWSAGNYLEEQEGIDVPWWAKLSGAGRGYQALSSIDPNVIANMPEGDYTVGQLQSLNQTPGYGRDPVGSSLQQAGGEQLEAARVAIGRQLAQALGRTNVNFAQRGVYRSGELGQARGELEQAALSDVANAAAGIGLQTQQLQAAIANNDRQYALQLATLEAQKDAANKATYAQIAEISIPYLIEYGGDIFGFLQRGGQPIGDEWEDVTQSPTLTAGPAPLQLPDPRRHSR